MAGLGFAAVGDFTLDENVREIAGQQVADTRGKFADGKDLARGLEIEGELAHFLFFSRQSSYSMLHLSCGQEAKSGKSLRSSNFARSVDLPGRPCCFLGCDFAKESFAVDREGPPQSIARKRVLPVVGILAARRAAEHFLRRLVFATKRSHEHALAIHDFIAIHFQIAGGVFVGGNFVDDVLVVTRGIGHGALGFALPGAEDFGIVAGRAGWARGECHREEKGASKDAGKGAFAGPGDATEVREERTPRVARHGQRIDQTRKIVIIPGDKSKILFQATRHEFLDRHRFGA